MVYGVWRRGQTWLSDLKDWRSSTSLSIFQLRFMSWLRSFHLKSASISRRRRGVQLIRLSSTSPKDREEEPRDFSHFLDMAIGSTFEAVACFFIAERQSYISKQDLEIIKKEAESLGKR